jgi:hypothetical protein
VFTNDVTPESVERIKEGKIIAETTHGFADWGWYGGEFAVMLACGEDPPDTYDIRPRTVYAVNADQFYPDPALPPIDWSAESRPIANSSISFLTGEEGVPTPLARKSARDLQVDIRQKEMR